VVLIWPGDYGALPGTAAWPGLLMIIRVSFQGTMSDLAAFCQRCETARFRRAHTASRHPLL